FKPVALGKPDIIMDLDPRKEVGNRPPQPKELFPFALTSEEYVLSYKKDQSIQYAKLKGVKIVVSDDK
ncbi:MAG: hypothetical protein AAGF77_12275, partial [Bacteroidota bacterium]